MKNFDLNVYGVSEMSEAQTRDVNGGIWWVAGIVVGLILSELNDRNSASDFAEGFAAAKSS